MTKETKKVTAFDVVAIEGIIRALNKRYGFDEDDFLLERASDSDREIVKLATGVFPIDYATEGGIPRGRVVRFYGPPSSGKSWLALRVIRENQHRYAGRQMRTCYVDIEGTFDNRWALQNGVDLDLVYLFCPPCGEVAVDGVQGFLHKGAFDLYVIDSLAQMTPMREYEESSDKSHMAVQARLVNSGIKKWVTGMSWGASEVEGGIRPSIILINQVRASMQLYGDPEFTPGGKAQEFASSLDLRLERKDVLTETGEIKSLQATDLDRDTGREKRGDTVAARNQFLIRKNKVGPSNRAGQYSVYIRDHGEHHAGDIVAVDFIFDLAVEREVIQKQGGQYRVGDATLGTTIEAAKTVLAKDVVLSSAVEQRLLSLNGPQASLAR